MNQDKPRFIAHYPGQPCPPHLRDKRGEVLFQDGTLDSEKTLGGKYGWCDAFWDHTYGWDGELDHGCHIIGYRVLED